MWICLCFASLLCARNESRLGREDSPERCEGVCPGTETPSYRNARRLPHSSACAPRALRFSYTARGLRRRGQRTAPSASGEPAHRKFSARVATIGSCHPPIQKRRPRRRASKRCNGPASGRGRISPSLLAGLRAQNANAPVHDVPCPLPSPRPSRRRARAPIRP